MINFKIHPTKHFKEYQKGVNDCYTLAVDIYAENGITLPKYHDVSSPGKRNKFKRELIDTVNYVEIDKIEKGAFILYRTIPWHCGIAVDNERMIHRSEGFDTRIEKVTEYGQKIAGIYLVKKDSNQ
jgi:cell wall-associated NlpC family hydrolase